MGNPLVVRKSDGGYQIATKTEIGRGATTRQAAFMRAQAHRPVDSTHTIWSERRSTLGSPRKSILGGKK